MDRLDVLKVFARVVERHSFVRAAEDLGLPPSTVTDAVKQLETHLGVRLLQRTTRHVQVNPDGEAYYRHALSILAEIEDAESAFRGRLPRGALHVGVSGIQARRLIVPSLPRFFAAYPDIVLTLHEEDRYVDLVREGIDCVLRAGVPKDSDLAVHPVASMAEVTVASPDYLVRFGVPTAWNALDGHRMVGFRSSATGGILPLEFTVDGTIQTVMLPLSLAVTGSETYQVAALQGLGLIQVPRYGVDRLLVEGRLVEVLPQTPPSPTPMNILYPRTRLLSPRVRVFIDWVVREYGHPGC